jgi:hypothetical protein
MKREQERLVAYTERAIRASDAGKLIPPIVYLPRKLRRMPVTLTEDNLALKVDGPTVAENHVKIASADPIGFLIAVMHGQPIPEFRITKDGAVEVHYVTPDFPTRLAVSKWLGNKATLRWRPDGHGGLTDKETNSEHRAMVNRAASALNEENADDN